jgi:hypothetical protein
MRDMGIDGEEAEAAKARLDGNLPQAEIRSSGAHRVLGRLGEREVEEEARP